MKLISINIGQKRIQKNKDREEITGIYKTPVTGSVQINKLGIADDFIASKKHHGGPDQALYIYGVDDYRWWQAELGRSLEAGTFGENLTIDGLESAGFNIGDTLQIGGVDDYRWWQAELGRRLEAGTFGENLTIDGLESAGFNIGDTLQLGGVTLQVTAPRIPCGTFASRMGDGQWVKRFRAAERPGLYVRVLREGNITAGDEVQVEAYEGETISLIQMFRDYYDKHKSEEVLRKHLNAPIAIRARVDLEKELERASPSG